MGDEERVSRFIVRGLMAERFAVDAAKDGDTGLQQVICLAHIGEVQVERTEGRGSLFIVSLR